MIVQQRRSPAEKDDNAENEKDEEDLQRKKANQHLGNAILRQISVTGA